METIYNERFVSSTASLCPSLILVVLLLLDTSVSFLFNNKSGLKTHYFTLLYFTFSMAFVSSYEI